ncbi:hypothetical protein CGLO_06166 [Colletotrichum gloeosporioides Cg-14]|nr:hypothetical protein CGLO_06166 [Colletotrichum gloeosporioides Cg-14]
MKILRSN